MVEDDDSVRKIGVRMLEGFGYSVLTASDGIEAISVFEGQNHHIDLVLMDVVMPRMDGPEAYRRMRALRANLPAIFVTGHDVKSDIPELEECSDGSPIRLLRKPYSRSQLDQEIGRVLGHSENDR